MAFINELLLLIFPTEIKLVLKIFIEDWKIDKHAAVKHQGQEEACTSHSPHRQAVIAHWLLTLLTLGMTLLVGMQHLPVTTPGRRFPMPAAPLEALMRM